MQTIPLTTFTTLYPTHSLLFDRGYGRERIRETLRVSVLLREAHRSSTLTSPPPFPGAEFETVWVYPISPSLRNSPLLDRISRTTPSPSTPNRTNTSSPRTKLQLVCTYPDCGKSFANNKNLNSHRVRHSQDKPFGCLLCPETLKRRGDLLRHVRVVHGRQSKLACLLCADDTSSDLRRLGVHYGLYHSGQEKGIELAGLIEAVVDFKKRPAMTSSSILK